MTSSCTTWLPALAKTPSMKYATPSHSACSAYDALPSEPRDDEHAKAAASGTTPPADQTAARSATVKSSACDVDVAPVGWGNPEHREGPPGSTTQPDGIATLP